MRSLAADLRALDQIVALTIEEDIRLQPVTPAICQHVNVRIIFVARTPLAVKHTVPACLADAVKRGGRDVGTILHLALDRRIFASLATVHIVGDAELGRKRQTASNQGCSQQRAAKKRTRYGRANSSENHRDSAFRSGQVRNAAIQSVTRK